MAVVPTDPSLIWVQPAWLEEATAWIRARLAECGLEQAGEIEQPHVRWWSTVLRIPTVEGDVWFKANAAPHAFEARLLGILERARPGHVPELVATDADRGWLIMRDGGERLRELVRSTRDLAHWEALLPEYAELQLALAAHVDELLGVGVPDGRLAVLPTQLARLLDDRDACMVGREHRLTEDEHEQLDALLPEAAERCAALAAYGIPETIQHDDLHDGNVFVRDGRYLVFDWGDSCVSHPFHSLVVTMRALAHRLELPPGGPDVTRLRDAYLEPFGGYASPGELVEAAELAHFTGTAARTLAWHRFLRAREPRYRQDDEEAVPYGLKRLLDLGPLGSWS
ncbi:MAG TPA: aminoglycoside phosphotransferase family protein [Gaiellaceae bacterium]